MVTALSFCFVFVCKKINFAKNKKARTVLEVLYHKNHSVMTILPASGGLFVRIYEKCLYEKMFVGISAVVGVFCFNGAGQNCAGCSR